MHDPQIDAFLRSGQKIQAIKRYRELTGAGLADAKHAIDRMSVGYDPTEFAAQNAGGGGGIVRLVLLLLVAAGLAWGVAVFVSNLTHTP